MRQAISLDQVRLVPSYSEILSRDNVTTAVYLGKQEQIELKIPVMASPMETICEAPMANELAKLGALGIIHRFMDVDKQARQVQEVVQKFGTYAVGAAVGVKITDRERLQALIDAGCGFIVFDIAHGHSFMQKEAVQYARKNFSKNMVYMGGSITTVKAVEDQAFWGIDIMRIGIGVGSHCTTTITTGVGEPMFSALQECTVYRIDRLSYVADGGLRTVGDIAKSIGAGAHAIMSGYLFAGTEETPEIYQRIGEFPHDKLVKAYRGSASQEAKRARGESERHIEGVMTLVEHKGTASRIIRNIHEGLTSAMSYCGSNTIAQFHKKAKFVRI